MQNLKVKHITKNYFFAFVFFIVFSFLVLGFSKVGATGAKEGLVLCSTIIIPSLFPFTVISVFFLKSGALEWIGQKLDKPSKIILGISGTEFSAIIISLLGGYPIGAKIIDNMYCNGIISKNKGKILIKFGINPSPAFFISFIGSTILKKHTAGVILFISNLISCLVLTALNGHLSKKDFKRNTENSLPKKYSLSDAFVISVKEASEIIINICAWTILFSTLISIFRIFLSQGIIFATINIALEITSGSINLAKHKIPIFFFSLALSFGGISSICQVKQACKNLNTSLFFIVFYRLLHGITAALISTILFKIFKPSFQTISNKVTIIKPENLLYTPSVFLIVFAFVFLIYLKNEKN